MRQRAGVVLGPVLEPEQGQHLGGAAVGGAAAAADPERRSGDVLAHAQPGEQVALLEGAGEPGARPLRRLP